MIPLLAFCTRSVIENKGKPLYIPTIPNKLIFCKKKNDIGREPVKSIKKSGEKKGEEKMERRRFNKGWTFYSKESPETKIPVTLPHDAMQLEDRIPRLVNGPLVAFYPGGDYYYEKTLHAGDEFEDKTVMLDFGGVFMDSHVYLNGEEVGGHVYGYSNFYVDLTGKLRIGEDNQILVYVHNSQTPNSRWYSGSGIYRPVHLIVASKEHVKEDGVKVVTKSYNPAILEVTVESTGGEDTEIVTDILWEGKIVASGTGRHCEIQVPNARLWDAEHPNLYTIEVRLLKSGQVIDTDAQRFGIRKIEWGGRFGLKINGKMVKLRGVCIHHDNGPLGAKEYKESALRRIRRLKEGGFNAIRGAHDPRSREVLEACDELGMYVMEEAFDVWFASTGVYGYALHFEKEWKKDLTAMVRKCFNHPCVVMYSIGNEIAETASAKGVKYARKMVEVCHQLDDSRPVTCGVNLMLNTLYAKGVTLSANGDKREMSLDDAVNPKACGPDTEQNGSVMINTLVGLLKGLMVIVNNPFVTNKPTKGIFGALDIAGYNYGQLSYRLHHKWYPDRVIVGSETNPMDQKQRIDLTRKLPHVIGDFYWTGWDYLGECGVGVIDYNKNTGGYSKPYPCIAAGCGLYDIIGHRDTMAYDLAIAWGVEKKPHIAVSHPKHAKDKMIAAIYRMTDGIDSWSFDGYEGVKTTVRVASVGKWVEVFVNGKSKGKKRLKDYVATFKVPYEKGVITAVSYDRNGAEIARNSLRSASGGTQIHVLCEKGYLKADGEDVVYFDVSLGDKDGIVRPLEKKVFVKVEGEGELLAVGSGAHKTEERYVADAFTTCNGRMIAVVRSKGGTGDIKVRFSCEGCEEIEERQVVIEAR